ncbi:MAG: HD domain-containing protein [Desulfovibrio sp.]
MNTSFELLEKRFQGYVADFFNGDADNDYHIDLKLRHSLRVYELAKRIVAGEALDPAAAQVALISALFHDTGRFPQFQRYKSFHDPSTANHARLGIRALIEADLLQGLERHVRRVVLGAVFLHNVRALPDGLREPLNAAVRVVRDSDKLDIVPVVLEHLEASASGSSVVTLGLQPHPSNYTHSIYEQVMAGESARYEEMRWANDFRLLVLGWIYDLNYPTSIGIFLERGYVDTLFTALPDDAPMRELREKVMAALAAREPASGPASGLDEQTPPR